MISSLVPKCWHPRAVLIYGGRGRRTVSRCGYSGKKRVLHSIWVVLPVYVTAFVRFLFYPFIHELSHAGSYEDGVKSHQLGSRRGLVVVAAVVCGCSAGIPHFVLLLLLAEEKKTSLNGSLLRLGCESKNENTSTRSGGNQLRREESCRLWHSVSLPPSPPPHNPPSPRQLECGRLFL